MLLTNGPDVEAELVIWAREWFELLAGGQLADACARLDESNHESVVWTPEKITELVQQTFGPGTVFAARHPEGPRFTSPRSARGRERYDIGTLADGSGFWLNYDVPLNGEFSDLTAQFEFHWREARALATMLYDLHIM